jgi:hypothetical protein
MQPPAKAARHEEKRRNKIDKKNSNHSKIEIEK